MLPAQLIKSIPYKFQYFSISKVDSVYLISVSLEELHEEKLQFNKTTQDLFHNGEKIHTSYDVTMSFNNAILQFALPNIIIYTDHGIFNTDIHSATFDFILNRLSSLQLTTNNTADYLLISTSDTPIQSIRVYSKIEKKNAEDMISLMNARYLKLVI